MYQVNISRRINTHKDKVWNIVDDFSSIHKYHPGVKKTVIVGNQNIGLGSQRICHFYDGSTLKETITEYIEGESYTFELSEYNFPFKRAFAKITLTPIGSDHCEVIFTFNFIPKFGLIGRLLATIILKRKLKGVFRDLLLGLEGHTITGKHVSKDGTLIST